jgi:type IV pilus assembly protein PilW
MRWNKGFTLVEILVAMAIASVVMAGIYSAYSSQQRSYIVQEQVAGMQQSLRAAMDLMERELRMVGFDPYGNSGAGIITAGGDNITFTFVADDDSYNNDGDGDTDESGELKTIRYSLYDSGGDGDADLGRKVGAGNNRPVAENIDTLNFIYLRENGTPTADISEIRSIQITMIARSSRVDGRYTDTDVYMNQQTTVIFGPKNDNFRRKLLTAQVNCRNLAF